MYTLLHCTACFCSTLGLVVLIQHTYQTGAISCFNETSQRQSTCVRVLWLNVSGYECSGASCSDYAWYSMTKACTCHPHVDTMGEQKLWVTHTCSSLVRWRYIAEAEQGKMESADISLNPQWHFTASLDPADPHLTRFDLRDLRINTMTLIQWKMVTATMCRTAEYSIWQGSATFLRLSHF